MADLSTSKFCRATSARRSSSSALLEEDFVDRIDSIEFRRVGVVGGEAGGGDELLPEEEEVSMMARAVTEAKMAELKDSKTVAWGENKLGRQRTTTKNAERTANVAVDDVVVVIDYSTKMIKDLKVLWEILKYAKDLSRWIWDVLRPSIPGSPGWQIHMWMGWLLKLMMSEVWYRVKAFYSTYVGMYQYEIHIVALSSGSYLWSNGSFWIDVMKFGEISQLPTRVLDISLDSSCMNKGAKVDCLVCISSLWQVSRTMLRTQDIYSSLQSLDISCISILSWYFPFCVDSPWLFINETVIQSSCWIRILQ